MQPSYDRERIELFLSARNLKNQDVLSVSDPKCKVSKTWVIFLKVFYKVGSTPDKQVGQTEAIKENLNPDWKKTIEIDYIFEMQQILRFEVWDVDDSGSDDMIGYA